MSYKDLSAEDKLEQAIAFVALDQPLPSELIEFLEAEGLYEAITNPQVQHDPS